MKYYLLSAALLVLLAAPLTAKDCNKTEGNETSTLAKRGGEKGEKGRKGKRGKKRRHPLKHLDTDQDGKISKAEAKGRILEKFDEIDTDADGFLTKEELKAFKDARKKEEAPTS